MNENVFEAWQYISDLQCPKIPTCPPKYTIKPRLFHTLYLMSSPLCFVCTGNESSILLQSLENLISPEEKLEVVLRKYGELVSESPTPGGKANIFHSDESHPSYNSSWEQVNSGIRAKEKRSLLKMSTYWRFFSQHSPTGQNRPC